MTKFEFKFVSSLTESFLPRDRDRAQSEMDRLLEEGWTMVGKGICGKGDASVGHWLKREVVPLPVLKPHNPLLPRWTANLLPLFRPQRRAALRVEQTLE